MNDLFGGVVYAGIDTDRYKYPIGSGRVTFGNQRSFMKAVKAGFVEIKTPKFTKKVSWDCHSDFSFWCMLLDLLPCLTLPCLALSQICNPDSEDGILIQWL